MTRRGFTLIELLAVMMLVALSAGVAAVAFRTVEPPPVSWRDQVASARRTAIASRRPVTGWTDSTGRFTAFADGLVVADSGPPFRFGFGAHAR